MKTEEIVVLPYNEMWHEEFEKIKRELEPAIGKYCLAIEHVGSTSVAGLSAKPIIDLDVILPNYKYFEEVIKALQKIGYLHEGDLGIKDREAFCYTGKPHLMPHHLYVCPQNSQELHRHLVFRDYLRNHKEAVLEYSHIKEKAAQFFPHDIDRYIQYKSPCIEAIYKKCGL